MANDKTSEELRNIIYKYLQTKSLLNADNPEQILEKFAVMEHLEWPGGDVWGTLWDMIMERIIKPRWHTTAGSLERFQLTEYGENLLKGLPIDRPNKYIEYLRSQVPNIDPRIIVYVEESLKSYNLGCYFASAIVLGVA